MSNRTLRGLAIGYFLLALANTLLYWHASPFYFLGFRDPFIQLWFIAMLMFTSLFLLLAIWLFSGTNIHRLRFLLLAVAVVFTLINGVPAFFLHRFYSKIYVLFHLLPGALLLPLLFTVSRIILRSRFTR